MSALKQRLGALMQQQRERCGLTQAGLGQRAGLSMKYIGEVERGTANVTVDALEKIAGVLEWDPWALFDVDRTPIFRSVHQLLLTDVCTAQMVLQALAEWLAAFEATTPKSAVPDVPADGGDGARVEAILPPLTFTLRRRVLPKRGRPRGRR